jgi:hypothetical protein
LITSILAIADYRGETPDKTIVTFDERPAGQPEALKAWFYPGDNSGVEFVYPKQRATELVQANPQPVLSETTDATRMEAAIVEPIASTPVTAANTPQDSTEIAQAMAVDT